MIRRRAAVRPPRMPVIAVLAAIAAALIGPCLAAAPVAAAPPTLSGPTGLITLPDARIDGGLAYHRLAGGEFYKFNLAIARGFLEAGVVSDRTRGTSDLNAKLALLSESAMLPAFAVGAYGFRSEHADASQYIVASKSIPMVGGVVHAGWMKRGRMKGLASLFNYANPLAVFQEMSDDKRAAFFGLEYPLFPLITLMGESVDGIVNAGIRVSPFDSLTLDVDWLDVRDGRYLKDRRVLNLHYRLGF